MSDSQPSNDARTREILRAAGAVDERPPFDISRAAVARLRGRRRFVGNVNELVRIFNHFVLGISAILGSPPEDREKPRE